jgi:hypothetical protein
MSLPYREQASLFLFFLSLSLSLPKYLTSFFSMSHFCPLSSGSSLSLLITTNGGIKYHKRLLFGLQRFVQPDNRLGFLSC